MHDPSPDNSTAKAKYEPHYDRSLLPRWAANHLHQVRDAEQKTNREIELAVLIMLGVFKQC